MQTPSMRAEFTNTAVLGATWNTWEPSDAFNVNVFAWQSAAWIAPCTWITFCAWTMLGTIKPATAIPTIITTTFVISLASTSLH